MATISEASPYVTQLNVIEVKPHNQAELVERMRQQASGVMRTLPGFISISLHQSEDGTRVVNYVQWETRELLDEAHQDPRFKALFEQYRHLQDHAGPRLYRVASSESREIRESEDTHG